ncbi:hypothetical protein A3C26_00025 [Candidatus Daviesbacteria bacterium RIFCSPHIGHO2_02_FULL_39_12]|uniref:Uncharacterized protein n=2 Tax=Candidatus Daviesiibacteriota TaxID=1752718 RepID=A0A1F5JC47_9BACT|nr:MAG: hypothetical protein A3C26_00025 [Candidatus Daviesbacteria bacterium RIFCSPHIGHO2_02_FULL_39_12]OGE71347.1 MAG: hypothetical protein A3H40_03575 [Candidatus Daviesbacteria bacterium RIFCSPLOWO2_02_FULL_38_15]
MKNILIKTIRLNKLLLFVLGLILIGNSQVSANQQPAQYISIVSYTINGQKYDANANNIKFSLSDLDKKEQPLHIIIEYSDNSNDYLIYNVEYNPPASSEDRPAPENPDPEIQPSPQVSPATCSYSENPRNCSNGGVRNCTGIWENGVCVWDSSGSVDPNCSESCNLTQENNNSASQDTSSDNCETPYTQCGKSFGLEDYEAEEDQTVEITPCRLTDGGMDFRKKILEGNPGNCPH